MGTSSNHPSPKTPTWQPLKAVLGNERVPTERQSAEVWRAAFADREGQLVDDLGSDIIARAAGIASSVENPAAAVAMLRKEIVESKSAGLVVDMANRALARACYQGGGRDRFSAELLAEAASYYTSRDLPSYVGAAGRVRTTSESIELKSELRAIARAAAEEAGPAPDDRTKWRGYVSNLAEILKRGGK